MLPKQHKVPISQESKGCLIFMESSIWACTQNGRCRDLIEPGEMEVSFDYRGSIGYCSTKAITEENLLSSWKSRIIFLTSKRESISHLHVHYRDPSLAFMDSSQGMWPVLEGSLVSPEVRQMCTAPPPLPRHSWLSLAPSCPFSPSARNSKFHRHLVGFYLIVPLRIDTQHIADGQGR